MKKQTMTLSMVLCGLWMLMANSPILAQTNSYDPLAVSSEIKIRALDLTVKDDKRHREIPLRVYFSETSHGAPVVLFSHGLGGSGRENAFMGNHWASRGYVVVFIQHPGSDSSVWQDKKKAEAFAALKKAANGRNFFLRVKDVPAVIDQLEIWNQAPKHALSGRLDLERLGMSGHSFGAVTTQAVSGQTMGKGKISFTDSRIKAALAFSPSIPRRGDPKLAFSKVAIPWLLMTGTEDVAPIGNADVASRLKVFPALPKGGKYQLVLFGAEHSAFTERVLPGNSKKRNPNHHRLVLALSTAFWDAWLKDESEARAWLDGTGPATLLEKKDHWQTK